MVDQSDFSERRKLEFFFFFFSFLQDSRVRDSFEFDRGELPLENLFPFSNKTILRNR